MNKFEPIDLVIVNFYPFQKTLEKTQDNKKLLSRLI